MIHILLFERQAMPAITAQIQQITELSDTISQCPESCLKTLLAIELHDNYEALEVTKSSLNYSIMALRWLKLTQHIQQEHTQSTNKLVKSLAVLERLKPQIDDYIQQYQPVMLTQDVLNTEIKKQQELIFSQVLANATIRRLKQFDRLNNPFSTNDVLKQAFLDYKQLMYYEALFQFETTCLIERYDYLMNRLDSENKDLIHGLMTITFQIRPELLFICTKLNTSNQIDLKLQGTRDLRCSLDDLSELTHGNVVTRVQSALDDVGSSNIDNALQSTNVHQNNIKVRQTSLYLNNKKYTTVFDRLSQEIDVVEQLEKDILSNIQPTKHMAAKTTDVDLVALRSIISIYENNLLDIEITERITFKERDETLVNNRKKALTTLEACINKEETLTPGLRTIIGTLVTEIKANRPQWKELSLIDKILDIITFGLHALIRLSTFSVHKSVIQLDSRFNSEAKEHGNKLIFD